MLEKISITDASRILVISLGAAENQPAHNGPIIVSEIELETVIQSGASWDAVIVTGDGQRFYETTTPQGLEAFAQWVRESSRILFIEPRHDLIDAGAFDLGPHRVPIEFGKFGFTSETGLAKSVEDTPILVLSDHYLWDGKTWHEAENLHEESSTRASLSWDHIETKPRTLETNNGQIIKFQVSSHDFFESNTVGREASALESYGAVIRSFSTVPEVSHTALGRAVSLIVRDKIEGSTLVGNATAPRSGKTLELARELITLACRLASAGLFHNDFRPWNIIDTAKGLAMIDFADLSTADLDVRNLPQTVALAGSLFLLLNLEWNTKRVRAGETFDTDTLAIVSDYLQKISMNISDLYSDSWLRLPEQESVLKTAVGQSGEDVLAALFGDSEEGRSDAKI